MSDTYNPDAILTDPNAHPTHKLFARINVGIRDHGERWAKCANCGDPYQLTPEWDNATACSERCDVEFAASFTDGR